MVNKILKILYALGILTMLIPFLSGKPHLDVYFIPIGLAIGVFSLFYEPKINSYDDILDNHMVHGYEFDTTKDLNDETKD